MNNVMLDIETLGKKAGCPILSVAAVMFEPATGLVGQTFYARIDYQAAIQYGQPEEETLLWWQKQSDDARHEAFGGKARPDVVARALRTFISTHCAKPCVPWSNGAVFDIALLQSWFDRVDPQKDDRAMTATPGHSGMSPTCAPWYGCQALMCALSRLTGKSIMRWPMRCTRSR
ncbi:3'-5' exonuclease [Candidatus Sodalis pierantonius]|uniref:3'-5' exonuclease n=1 Tax=Candidatus Sodalis pierantonii TaxID=1486991 RepID=UPI0004BCDEFE|nr:3'-5' exonuclease [Candidatus Sodalis pierantonius]